MFCGFHCPFAARFVLLDFKLRQMLGEVLNILCMLGTNHFAHIAIILMVARAIQDCGLANRREPAHQGQILGLPYRHKS